MPWWRILAHSLQAPLSNIQLPLQLVSFCICICSTQWPSGSASSSPPGLCFRLITVLQMFTWHIECSWTVCWLFFIWMLVLLRSVVLGRCTLWGPECISTMFCGFERTGKCPRGIEVNTVKGAPLLTGHTYRHPSTCRAPCHTSQQPADGFILSPALSPLLFYVTFLPASCLHLSSICYILLSVSCSFGVISHSCFTFSRRWCFGCFIGIFDNQGRECSLFKKKKKKVDLSCWCRQSIYCRHLMVLLIFVAILMLKIALNLKG